MIACVAPADIDCEESISTLKYAGIFNNHKKCFTYKTYKVFKIHKTFFFFCVAIFSNLEQAKRIKNRPTQNPDPEKVRLNAIEEENRLLRMEISKV